MRRFVLLFTLAGGAWAQEEAARRILAARCWTCHAETAAGGLRLDSRGGMLRGGKSGTVLLPGKPDESRLLQAVLHAPGVKPMPPGPKLSDADAGALRTWIAAGAPWTDETRHWAFEPLRAEGLSIDAHLRRVLDKQGIVPNGPASERTFARRVAYDLTGLPPDREALTDRKPGWYERLIDRLLASPHFGEKWGRHWLDVARYGEDDFGGTAVVPYKNAWRYRDWVIGAWNRDLPYDQFLKAQIAGDLIDGGREIAGLGLFGLGPWYYGISQPPQARADERNDRVDMVTRGMLGVTVACARCHDHKYDPISIEDYYGLAGVFASSKYHEYPLVSEAEAGEWKRKKADQDAAEKALNAFLEEEGRAMGLRYLPDTPRFLMGEAGLNEKVAARWKKYLEKPEEFHPFLNAWFQGKKTRDEAERFTRLIEDIVQEKTALDAANKLVIDEAKKKEAKPARAIVLPGGYRSEEDFNPGAFVVIRSLERDRFVAWNRTLGETSAPLRFPPELVAELLEGTAKQRHEELKAKLEAAKKALPEQYGFFAGLAEDAPWDLQLHLRGNPENLGKVIPRRFPRSLGGMPLRAGTGRRELAEAVARHPLAARVAVNRIWMHLFGEGLVRTPSNFGKVGDRPVLPELLDELASGFARKGYSVKGLIREILLSDAYRRTSLGNAANETKDGANRYVWRQARRRLEAEGLQDAMLAASGELKRTLGGESAALDAKFLRRTVYAKTSRFQQDETLSLFDLPSAAVTCEQRAVTNVPLQKLYFLNSEIAVARAKALAAGLGGMQGKDAVRALYDRVLLRKPTSRELRLGTQYLKEAGAQGIETYAQVLLSSNEFAYVD
jgi:hypothetical protein